MSRVALLLHGAGSCPETVLRLLGPAVPTDAQVLAPHLVGTVGDWVEQAAALARGHEVVLVGGVSLGAHAAALWAASAQGAWPLLLAMPAWTGPPGEVAAATAAAADDLALRGSQRVLGGLVALAPDDWVVDELAVGWADHPDDEALVRALRDAASSPGPDLDDLGRVRGPAAVVALDDDPVHPRTVAEQWATRIPRAALAVVPRHAPGDDRGALGRAGARLLRGLSGSR